MIPATAAHRRGPKPRFVRVLTHPLAALAGAALGVVLGMIWQVEDPWGLAPVFAGIGHTYLAVIGMTVLPIRG